MNLTVTIENDLLKFNPPSNWTPEERTNVSNLFKGRMNEITPSPVVEFEGADPEVAYAELPLLMSQWNEYKAKAKLALMRFHLSQGAAGYLAGLPV